MRQQLLHQSWIVVAASLVFLTNLGGAGLWDEDEPLYASCARAMIERGDWVVPMYNGQMFPDKPPLMYWTMAAGFKVFGVNEFGARIFSALMAIGTALVTYHLGRRLFRAEVGLWAGLIVASSLAFTVSARAATVDSALVLVTALAIWVFVSGGMAKRAKTGKPASGTRQAEPAALSFLPDSWISFALMWTCGGVAVLAKGPVGLLLPMASIGLFLMVMNHRAAVERAGEPSSPGGRLAWLPGLVRMCGPRNFLVSLWQMRPLMGILVVTVVALPWFVLVAQRTDGVWVEQFLLKFNLRPFTEPIQGHGGPIWYYVPAIMIGFFPWSVFMGPTVMRMVRRIRDGHTWQPAYILMACWVGVFFVFWSICSTKLPHYVLPVYPALALLVAAFLDGWIREPAAAQRRWLRTAFFIPVFVGLGMVVALPIVASIFAPGEELLGLVGLILVAGGGFCLYAMEHDRRGRAVGAFAVTCVAFVTAIFGFAALRVDRHQYARPLVAAIREHSAEQPQLAGFRFLRESVVFYAATPVTECRNARQLQQFLDAARHPYVVTLDEHRAEIEEHFPGELYEVARRPRFLRPGAVVVLAPRTASNVARTAGRMQVGAVQ